MIENNALDELGGRAKMQAVLNKVHKSMKDDEWTNAIEWTDGLARVLENNAPEDILLQVYEISLSKCLGEQGI